MLMLILLSTPTSCACARECVQKYVCMCEQLVGQQKQAPKRTNVSVDADKRILRVAHKYWKSCALLKPSASFRPWYASRSMLTISLLPSARARSVMRLASALACETRCERKKRVRAVRRALANAPGR